MAPPVAVRSRRSAKIKSLYAHLQPHICAFEVPCQYWSFVHDHARLDAAACGRGQPCQEENALCTQWSNNS